MEAYTATPMEPISRSPLTFKGVFGIAWMLYRRSFKGLVPLCALVLGVPVLLIALPTILISDSLNQATVDGVIQSFGVISDFYWVMRQNALLLLLLAFWLMPMLTGCTYIEMDQCVEGRPGTFQTLRRYAMPVARKNLYGTYFARGLMSLAAISVIAFLSNMLLSIFDIPNLRFYVGSLGSENFPANTAEPWASLLTILINAVGMSFYELTFPTAVREGKRAFKAVGRAFQLGRKRFGRAFFAYAMLSLISYACFTLLPYGVSVAFSNAVTKTISPWLLIAGVTFGLLIMILYTPFTAALNTALYIDSAARIPPQGEPAPAELPNTPYGQYAITPKLTLQPPLYPSAYGQPVGEPKENLPARESEDPSIK